MGLFKEKYAENNFLKVIQIWKICKGKIQKLYILWTNPRFSFLHSKFATRKGEGTTKDHTTSEMQKQD